MYLVPKGYEYAAQYINGLAGVNVTPSSIILNELRLLKDLKKSNILDGLTKYSLVSIYPKFMLSVLKNLNYPSSVDVFDFTQPQKFICIEEIIYIFTQQVVIKNYKNEMFNKLIDSKKNRLIYICQPTPLPDGRKKSDGIYIDYMDFKRWKAKKTSSHHMGIKKIITNNFLIEHW